MAEKPSKELSFHLELLLRPFPSSQPLATLQQRDIVTHLIPRIAFASFASILTWKPPFTHASAPPFPAWLARARK